MNLASRIPVRYKVLSCFLIWGAALLFLLRFDAYGLEEGAAHAILLVWSFVDQVAHPVVVLGAPDFRAILFAPAGMMWTGNIAAIKILSILILAASALLLYDWKKSDQESALLATGLLLISPLAIAQVDSIGSGPYLLLALGLGVWLDNAYRKEPKPLGGWYISQIALVSLSVSLHPAGLAYPLSLLWQWRKNPIDAKQQKQFYTGIISILVFVLLVRMGWGLAFFQNPIESLASAVFGPEPESRMSPMRWIAGSLAAILLAMILLKNRKALWADMAGRTFVLGLIFGAFIGDTAWSLFALGFLLYEGIPMLIKLHEKFNGANFMTKRGGVVALVFVLSTVFMVQIRSNIDFRKGEPLSIQDALLDTVSLEVKKDAGSKKRVLIASQWPARTMIACQCDVLPLPSPAKDPETQLAMVKGISYMVFDPRKNEILSRNIAYMGGATETLSIQPGGVFIRFREQPNK